MSDPRNVAHAKKVSQEKKHHGAEASPDGAPADQPGKKTARARKKNGGAATPAEGTEATAAGTPDAAAAPIATPPAALTGSLIVLTKLKELEFHSRAHLERLAELSMTVEEELKQASLVGAFGEVYAAQSALQTKLTALLESYKAECDRMQPES